MGLSVPGAFTLFIDAEQKRFVPGQKCARFSKLPDDWDEFPTRRLNARPMG
jgi:hypothetical protein